MYARRVDTKHADIIAELRQIGYSVADTSGVGHSFPDLVVGRNGMDAKVELKTPRGRKKAYERLSDGQATFARDWKGSPVIVAYCAEDVHFKFSLLLKRSGWVK